MNLAITISDKQKKTLNPYAAPIISALAGLDGHHKKYAELANKDQLAEKQVAKHQRAAAGFDSASELQLIAAMKQRERLREAMGKIEEQAHADKLPLFYAIDRASSALQQILQGAYEQLLDQCVAQAGPCFDNPESLRFESRSWPVVRSFVHQLLTSNVTSSDSVERLVAAGETLRSRIETLLDDKFVWSFQGVNGTATAKNSKAA
jgi:hypothetical protein